MCLDLQPRRFGSVTPASADIATPNSPVRVLLADGNATMRLGLSMLLAGEPGLAVMGETADLPSTLRALRRDQPDALVLNVHLLGGAGARRLPMLRQAAPLAHIIATGLERGEAFARHILASGASLYLPSEQLVEELPGAIRALADAGA